MRLSHNSAAFTLLLGVLAALPSFGIDMNLPALGAVGASFGVGEEGAGLTMSLFMASFAIGPPISGTVSDRMGRKPVMLAAVALFAVASLGCATAFSLPELLAWRVVQGTGAGVAMTTAFAIISDVFRGAEGRTKFSTVTSLMLFIPMVSPAVGTAMLTVGSWRSIYELLAGIGLVLLFVIWISFTESARTSDESWVGPAGMVRDYARILAHPVCRGYILVNAAGFGALFAYVSGSSAFLIGALGLSRGEYSLIFAATSLGIMAGSFANGRLSRRGVAPIYPLGFGLMLALASAVAFLATVMAGSTWLPGLIAILMLATASFGLIAPNATHAALQPLPAQAGAVSAVAGCVQVAVGSASSAIVSLGDAHPGLSMALSMVFWSVMALLAHMAVARPAELRTSQHGSGV